MTETTRGWMKEAIEKEPLPSRSWIQSLQQQQQHLPSFLQVYCQVKTTVTEKSLTWLLGFLQGNMDLTLPSTWSPIVKFVKRNFATNTLSRSTSRTSTESRWVEEVRVLGREIREIILTIKWTQPLPRLLLRGNLFQGIRWRTTSLPIQQHYLSFSSSNCRMDSNNKNPWQDWMPPSEESDWRNTLTSSFLRLLPGVTASLISVTTEAKFLPLLPPLLPNKQRQDFRWHHHPLRMRCPLTFNRLSLSLWVSRVEWTAMGITIRWTRVGVPLRVHFILLCRLTFRLTLLLTLPIATEMPTAIPPTTRSHHLWIRQTFQRTTATSVTRNCVTSTLWRFTCWRCIRSTLTNNQPRQQELPPSEESLATSAKKNSVPSISSRFTSKTHMAYTKRLQGEQVPESLGETGQILMEVVVYLPIWETTFHLYQSFRFRLRVYHQLVNHLSHRQWLCNNISTPSSPCLYNNSNNRTRWIIINPKREWCPPLLLGTKSLLKQRGESILEIPTTGTLVIIPKSAPLVRGGSSPSSGWRHTYTTTTRTWRVCCVTFLNCMRVTTEVTTITCDQGPLVTPTSTTQVYQPFLHPRDKTMDKESTQTRECQEYQTSPSLSVSLRRKKTEWELLPMEIGVLLTREEGLLPLRSQCHWQPPWTTPTVSTAIWVKCVLSVRRDFLLIPGWRNTSLQIILTSGRWIVFPSLQGWTPTPDTRWWALFSSV